jgi:uncharacterized protein YciI
MHYILTYDVVHDYLERRGAHRAAHFAQIRRAFDRGEIVLAGALANPADGAVFIFRGSSTAAAEAFAKADPYVLNGLVTAWRVREWTTVIGDGVEPPALVA